MAADRLFSAVLCGFVLTATHAWAFELTLTESLVDQAAHVIYNPVNGDLSLFSPNDLLQSMQIESASEAFIVMWNPSLCRWHFQCTPWKHFDFVGFESVEFGPIVPSDRSAQWIPEDIIADGLRVAGGRIDSSPGGGP